MYLGIVKCCEMASGFRDFMGQVTPLSLPPYWKGLTHTPMELATERQSVNKGNAPRSTAQFT